MKDGKPYAPRRLEDFEILPQVPEAIQALADAGYLIFVATNQPDIGNGLVDAAIVEQMHAQLMARLPIEKIYVCQHSQKAGCDCRKPKPGMLLQAQHAYDLEMSTSYMIGDRAGDVAAGLAAGCTPIFIDKNYIETPDLGATLRAKDLPEASAYILKHQGA